MQSNDKLEACTDFSKMGCIITKKKEKRNKNLKYRTAAQNHLYLVKQVTFQL